MSMNGITTAQAANKKVEVFKPVDIRFPLILLQDPTTEFIFWGHISMADARHLTQEDVEDLFDAGDEVIISPIMTVASFFNNWGDPRRAEPPVKVKSPTGDPYYWGKYRQQIRALYGNPGKEDDPAPLTASEAEVKNYSRRRRILWLIDHAGGGGGGSTVNECCYWS